MGTGTGRGRRQNRGEDLRVTIQLTLEEIASGIEKSVKVKRFIKCNGCNGSGVAAGSSKKTCSQCHGNGQVRRVTRTFLGTVQQVSTCGTCRGTGEVIADPCKACHGEGRVRGENTVKLNIPAGVASGNYMTVDGMGNVASHEGEPGDLIAVFQELEHDFLVRQDDHVVCEFPISFATAALGGTAMVRTLFGEEQLKIPAGTQKVEIYARLYEKVPPFIDPNSKKLENGTFKLTESGEFKLKE